MARKKRTELTSNERESEQKTVPDHIIIFSLSAIDVVKEGDSGAALISNKITFIKKKALLDGALEQWFSTLEAWRPTRH